jgi:DNA-binding LacI/PurR family transcriptional regulator/DNA-binding transcriptional regulator YhcF (GntR family)
MEEPTSNGNLAWSGAMPPGDIVRRAIGLLREHIAASSHETLPSMKRLASLWGISQSTIAKAAHVLRDRGEIHFARGQKIHITGRTSDIAPRKSSALVLAGELEEQICTGQLRTGQQLPKVAVYARAFHASENTVIQAFRILRSKGLVHKAGKPWYIGPPPAEKPGSSLKPTQPTIVVLGHSPRAWGSLDLAYRTRNFTIQFSSESRRYGVRLLLVSISASDMFRASGWNRERAAQLIRKLGPRYLGTLIISSRNDIRDMKEWIDLLLRYRRPVVWFDRNDEGLPDREASRLLRRCHFDERSAVRLALETLYEAGHRNVAHALSGVSKSKWKNRRLRLIQEEARSMEMDVFGMRECGFVLEGASQTVDDWVHAIARVLLHSRKATALIAPSDYMACQYYERFSGSNIRIPRQLSLISFDNSTYAHTYGLSSVDFGFDYLGYAAFHTIHGSIPVRRSKAGDIPSKPFIDNRDTIAGPPLRPLHQSYRGVLSP